ncbi:MAG: response regulator transcription factor [Streptosporangiaceae bacterium]|nr:response regulator transcription factor [Streptosporangiaceae bacterium]MBV9856110.1 response regulator transcription factor [Streptosporangiaceae bacterium]
MTIRVLIADDQPLVRVGLRTLLGAQPDITVAGEAADGAAAIAESERLRPDVVLMDVRMPGTDGIEAAGRVCRGPDAPRVLILTTYDRDEYVFDALAAGASGFLLKDARPEDLVAGVRIVAAGDALLAPSVTRRLIGLFARRPREAGPDARARPRADLGALTGREREVLRLVARGLSNAEIAAALYVSENTVKTHVGHVFTKLGLRDRVQAVIFAYENGLARD